MASLPHEKQIEECAAAILRFRKEGGDSLLTEREVRKLEQKLTRLRQKVYSSLTPSERVTICRHPKRPHTIDYIRELCGGSFHELHGDRLYADDPSVIGGLGRIGGQPFLIVGQEKGNDTESRIERNFGMPHPEGFRKALRLMQLGARFRLPILSFIDTPGAFPGLAAEERGQAWAIAENLREMMSLVTPIIVLLIGEACSGGALAMAVGDSIGMLEHSYYSVISPEGCASILWKDASKAGLAAETLRLNSEYLLELGIIDAIIPEPLGGAHHDPQVAFSGVEQFILSTVEELRQLGDEQLLERRYHKFREIGSYESAELRR